MIISLVSEINTPSLKSSNKKKRNKSHDWLRLRPRASTTSRATTARGTAAVGGAASKTKGSAGVRTRIFKLGLTGMVEIADQENQENCEPDNSNISNIIGKRVAQISVNSAGVFAMPPPPPPTPTPPPPTPTLPPPTPTLPQSPRSPQHMSPPTLPASPLHHDSPLSQDSIIAELMKLAE